MAGLGLLASLPQPKNADKSNSSYAVTRVTNYKNDIVNTKPVNSCPSYMKREGFVPRKQSDFGDGGSFPEIFVPQFPLGLGRPNDSNNTNNSLALSVDAAGDVRYDAIINKNDKIVYHSHSQLVPKIDELRSDLSRPTKEEEDEAAKKTQAALEKRVQLKLSAAQPTTIAPKPAASQFIKYTPAYSNNDNSNGVSTRVIKMSEAPLDPFEPPKFRHKRVPKGPGSPPVPVMHSPPRAVTAQDQQDWKIPPCISNWKNSRGYTIPLDKRLAADGRGLQDVSINDNFAKLSESLYVAEQTARKAVEMRSKIQKEIMMREKEQKEETLRDLAQRARMERAGAGAGASIGAGERETYDVSVGGRLEPENGRSFAGGRRSQEGYKHGNYSDDDVHDDAPRRPESYVNAGQGTRGLDDDKDITISQNVRMQESEDERRQRLRREEIREERRRERERERRLEAKGEHLSKKSKITRDRDRDVSERIALGQANIKSSGEAMYDQRLFNQEGGIGSGYNKDDAYDVYDKALFADRGSSLYRPKAGADDDDVYGGDGNKDVDKMLSTAKFKPDKGFSGAEDRDVVGGARAGPRSKPVEFEVDADDPFGLDQFMTEVNTGKKAMENIGSKGTMHAAGGGSGEGGNRRRVDFHRGSE